MIHENSYRSTLHHCYGSKRPLLQPGASVNSDKTTAKELAERRSSEPRGKQPWDTYLALSAPPSSGRNGNGNGKGRKGGPAPGAKAQGPQADAQSFRDFPCRIPNCAAPPVA